MDNRKQFGGGVECPLACPRPRGAPLYVGGSARPVRRGFDYIPRDRPSPACPLITRCRRRVKFHYQSAARTRDRWSRAVRRKRAVVVPRRKGRCRAPLMDRFLRTTLAPLATTPPSRVSAYYRRFPRPFERATITGPKNSYRATTMRTANRRFSSIVFGGDRPSLPRYGESTARLSRQNLRRYRDTQ